MKSYNQHKIFWIMGILFLLLAVPGFVHSQDLFSDFSEKQLSSDQLKILTRLQNDSSSIDLRIVKVNMSLFKTNNPVNFNLSSNKSFMAIKEKLNVRGDSDFDWSASIPGKNSDILLSVYQEAVVGYMVIDNQFYNLHSLGNGVNAIVHADPRKYPPCGNGYYLDNSSQDSTTFDNSSKNHLIHNKPKMTIEKLLTTNTIIRVLVAYTDSAREEAGGVNAMNALIANSIASANDAFENSNVNIELEPVHRYEVNHDESSNTNSFTEKWCEDLFTRLVTLEQFQDPSDGEMDEIHTLRDAYAADLCVLLTTSAIGVGGQAYEINVDEDEAFCIVKHGSANAAGSWSFAHEIGHLLGGRHQTMDDGRDGYDPCDEPYFYAHGYDFEGNDYNNYRTMMHVDGNEGARIKYFANPFVEYLGTDTGDDDHDVASVFNERRFTVSNFRVNHNIKENVTLTEDLEIQSGLTLTVQPDVIVKFDPGIKLNIYGTMSALGTSSQPITFTSSSANPQKGDWDGVKFDGATSSSSLKYCKIQYATRALDIDNSDITIELNEIYNCSGYGIYIYDAEPTIYNNYIHDTDDYGIAANSAGNTYIRKNSIIDCRGGVVAWGNNSIKLRGTSGNSYGLNKIDNWGNGSGVYILGGTPDLGQYSPWNQRGYNDILRDSQYAVDNRTGSEVDAEKNYWGGAPQSSWFYGNVNYDFPLAFSQGAGSDLAKMTGMDADKELLVKGNELLDAGRFKGASVIYKSLIDQFPDSRHGGKALAWAMAAEKSANDLESQRDYLLKKRYHKNPRISGKALLWLQTLEATTGNKKASENIVDSVPINDLVGWEIRLNWANDLLNVFGDSLAAEAVFAALRNEYSDQVTAEAIQIIRQTARKADDVLLPKPQAQSFPVNLPQEFSMSQNYPNPFNPETEIRFQILKEEHVSLVVYNLLGQKIRILVDKEMAMGNHSIKWDGRNEFGITVASGVYLYAFKAGKFFDVKKMVLMQ